MDALLHLTAPSHNLKSLQLFYNAIQIHIRALSSLNTPPDSYGPLLTTSIHSKLPQETRTNMARDHYGSKWTVSELLTSISKEIQILKPVRSPLTELTATPILLQPRALSIQLQVIMVEHHVINQGKRFVVFFAKGHTNPACVTQLPLTKIVLPLSRIVACLARHKISQCPSKFTCKDCHKKTLYQFVPCLYCTRRKSVDTTTTKFHTQST